MPPKKPKPNPKGGPSTLPQIGTGHLPPNYIGPACKLELYTDNQIQAMISALKDPEVTEELLLLPSSGTPKRPTDTGGKKPKDAPKPKKDKPEYNPYRGHVPDKFIPDDKYHVHDMEATQYGMKDKYEISVVREYLFDQGFTLVPILGDGDCLMSAIISQMGFKSSDCEVRYQPIYMRRQVVAHICQNLEVLKNWLITQLRNTYGGVGGDEEQVGPFSVKSYLQYIATPGKFADAIFIALVCSMWALTASVVRTDSCAVQPFRHQNRKLNDVDFVLIFNCNMRCGHYSSVRRINGEWLQVGKVVESKGFDKKLDMEERLGSSSTGTDGSKSRGKKDDKGGKGDGKGDAGKPDEGGEGGSPSISPEKLQRLEQAEGYLRDIRAILKGKRPPSAAKGKASSSEEDVEKPDEVQEIGKGDTACKSCGREFEHTPSLRRHVNKMHKNKYRYRCALCSKGLISLDGLREHLKAHEGKIHRCSKCSVTFGAARALHKHERETHLVQEAQQKKKDQKAFQYVCKYCKAKKGKRAYASDVKRYFDAHVTSCKYNPNRPNLECDLCMKEGFATNSQLMLHKKRYHNW